MSFTKFPNELFVLLRGDKRDHAARILIMLRVLHRCGFEGDGVCFETRDKIALAVGISNKTVTRVMQSLEKDQWICINRQHRNSNHVTLTDKTKQLLEGQLARLNRDNSILFSRAKCPSNEDEDMKNESVKRPRKKKPKTKKEFPKYISELDRIHEEWLEKQKSQQSESDDKPKS